MNTDNIKLHLSRLHRHYNLCVKSYDYIAMLDLAVALYNLTELIDDINQVTDKVFTVTDPHIKLTRLFKNYDHIYFEIPNPIITYTTGFKGEMRETFFWPDYIAGDNKEYVIRSNIEHGENINEIKFNYYFFRNKSFSKQEGEIFNKYIMKTSNKKRKFMHYMTGNNFILYKIKDHKYHSISRRELIKTVADRHNARHVKVEGFQKTKYTDPVNLFMDFKMAGLPIPFFALLHIANDILSNDTLSKLVVTNGSN